MVTGASRGVGAEFARQLAQRGLDLVLVARQVDLMESLAASLTATYGVDVRTVPVDLLSEDAVDIVLNHTESLDVGLFISNAGVAVTGSFLNLPARAHSDAAVVNGLRPMPLTHAFGNRLAARGSGGIVLVTSMAGHQPTPYQASYAASKAYLSFLGRALRVELATTGVDVMTLALGATNTDMLRSSPLDWDKVTALGVPEPPPVVAAALDGLGRKAIVIPGTANRLFDMAFQYLVPRSVAPKLIGRVFYRMLIEEDPR